MPSHHELGRPAQRLEAGQVGIVGIALRDDPQQAHRLRRQTVGEIEARQIHARLGAGDAGGIGQRELQLLPLGIEALAGRLIAAPFQHRERLAAADVGIRRHFAERIGAFRQIARQHQPVTAGDRHTVRQLAHRHIIGQRHHGDALHCRQQFEFGETPVALNATAQHRQGHNMKFVPDLGIAHHGGLTDASHRNEQARPLRADRLHLGIQRHVRAQRLRPQLDHPGWPVAPDPRIDARHQPGARRRAARHRKLRQFGENTRISFRNCREIEPPGTIEDDPEMRRTAEHGGRIGILELETQRHQVTLAAQGYRHRRALQLLQRHRRADALRRQGGRQRLRRRDPAPGLRPGLRP